MSELRKPFGFWTAERVAELGRLRKAGTPTKILAAHFGASRNAIYTAAKRYGLDRIPVEMAKDNLRAMNRPGARKPYKRGHKLSAEHRANISAALRASDAHAAAHVSRREKNVALNALPEVRERRRENGIKSAELRADRVPPPYRDEYRWLTQSKGLKAADARAALKPQINRWLQTFEGQLWRVSTGQARVVPKIPFSRPVTAEGSLVGSGLAGL